MIAVTTENLTKRYAARAAVDGIDLELPAGMVTGFVGPNGAGKTTTIRMLLGLVTPTAGRGTVFGEPLDHPERYLSRVGAMIEGPAFYPTMSGRQNLRVLSRLGGIDAACIDSVLEVVGLRDRASDAYGSYSQGMKQRLGLAAALLPSPDLLILDEPTNGLDPAGIREMRLLLRSLADQGTTVFVSSHLLSEVEVICDNVALIARGRIRYQGPIKGLTGAQRTHLRAVPERPEDLGALLAMCQHEHLPAYVADGELVVEAAAEQAGWLNRTAFSRGITLVGLAVTHPNLEDAFFAVTADDREAVG